MSGAAAPRGEQRWQRDTPGAGDPGDLAPRQPAVGGDVVDTRDALPDDELEAPDDVLLLDELDLRVETGDRREDPPRQVAADRRLDARSQHVGEPEDRHEDVPVVVGEVANVALDLRERAFESGPGRPGARRVLGEPRRVLGPGAVDEGGRLHDDLAHRRAGCAGRGEKVHRPDDVDLVKVAAGHLGRVDDEKRVHDGVHLCRPHDPLEQRVALVGTDILGALQLDRGLPGPHAEDHLDLGMSLERCGHPAAPEGVETGYEYPASHQLSRTRRSPGSPTSRKARPGGRGGSCRLAP